MNPSFRLSPQQERLWRLGPGVPYAAGCLVRLSGPCDRAALGRALAALVARHEILRTAFPPVSGLHLPLQSIAAEPALRLTFRDAAGEAPAAPAAPSAAAFDLEMGPPLHAELAAIAPGEHLLRLALPALCGDPASLLRLLDELREAYAAGGVLPAEAPVQFADLAEWQHELLESEEMEAGKAFWRRQELGDRLALRLPAAAAQPAGGPFLPQRLAVRIAPALAGRLAELAAAQGASLASLLAAAWEALLWRLLGGSAPVIGTLVDGRSYEDLKTAVGPLARLLPQASRCAAGLPFADFWVGVREAAAELGEWQDYFLWQDLSLHGSDQGLPFCSLAFESVELPPASEAGGLVFTVERLEACLDRFELKLSAAVGADGAAACELSYDPRVYGAEEVGRIRSALEALLADAAERPATPLDELRLISDPERRQLTLDLDPARREPAGRLVHQQFEDWARRRPDLPAVVDEHTWLTFGNLDARAGRLARHLRSLGVGPEVPVGLCLERSAETVVALLAVLKAGGAYLPLDPALPSDRLEFMLAASGARLILAQQRLCRELPGVDVRWIAVDAEILEDADLPAPAAVDPANAAYVLFTSGSTGQPKGVVVEHRQLASYVRGILERLDLPEGASYATVSTFAADLGNTALFPALCTGGCLHVISQERLFDPEAFAEYCERHPIDCLKIVPSHLEALLAASRPERVLPRRRLVLGGEAARRSWIEQLRSLAPASCRILNHYGPTETTVGVLTYALEDDLPSAAALPLGRPLANARVYVADRRGEPVPFWVAGELLVGGDNVSRGYLGRPDLTAERFVPDPFAGLPGERLYRTGDLARVRPDGNREFLGRVDDQVKIHGFRIEPGEVAAVLAGHPGVRDCAVLAREDQPGERRLVAYLVARGEAPTVADLRQWLGRRLPEFMLPAAFLTLPSLPLNANGKVDRGRLPAPDPVQLRSEAEYVAPATAAEQVLAELWAEVLGLDRIGIRDNFFHLGGDSIRSIEVRAKARRRGLQFSIAQMFEHQTIERLARHLETAAPGEGQEGAAAEYVPFSLVPEAERGKLPADAEDAYPLCMMQQGMLFHSLLSADAATYHDVGSYRFRVPYDPDAFRRAAGTLVGRHAALRTSFDFKGFGEPLQIVHRTAEIPVEAGDWQPPAGRDPEAAWDAWIDEEVRRPFRWDRAPLFRTFLHRLDDGTQITVSFHHSILDGWSRHSLVTELVREYLRELGWEIPPLPPLPRLSYGEFIALERAAVASEEHRRFWREALADAVRTTLPRRPVPPDAGAGLQARLHVTFLPRALSQGLHRLARTSGVPIKSVLLAATLRMLAEHNGRLDAMNGLVVNGRPEKDDGDRVSGLFLNTVPLRLRMAGGSWLDLVRAAYAAEAALLPFRRFPLAELQRLFGAGEPLFTTTFNYMHYHVYRRVLEVSGLEFLGYKGFEETNLTCVVNFHQDPVNDDIQLGIEYHASVLYAEQIEKMASYLLATLGAMAEDPAARYDLFSPLGASERHQLLVEWNDTRAALPETCLHELCADQARRTPGDLALVCGDERLSYAELDGRANQLAWELQSRGVGPDVPVAVFAERSTEMVVALLGVLKAGGAYVPLDPDLPPARLALMIADVAPPVVLTQARLAAALPSSPAQILRLDADGPAVAARPATAPWTGVQPDNAAYVIYTSGSTGQPKGAVNTHRAICNRLLWMQEAFRLTGEDRVLQKTPYSFDVSVWELFWPLMTGAALVVARPGGHRDGAYLLRLIAEQRVTTLHFVPSMLRVFLDQPGIAAQGAPLRRVICSGEALPLDLARRLGERTAAALHNLYGPTEAAVDVTWWPCRAGDDGVPIGRPIANLRIHLASPQLAAVPEGVPGELLIGGVGLARGYLRRPGLTAERFIPDPWSGRPGDRLYCTGDLARCLPGGALEYLGRIDHQVKVRGFRIELGEIESVLLRHPGVRECAVIARGSAADPVLVAYWTPAAQPAPDPAELRSALRAELPEHMVPASFVALDAMPLNASGKLDRRALPDLAGAGPREAAYLPPSGEVERTLAELWQELLGIERVGVLENFFDLGGHSLHLLRLHIKLQEALGREVPLVELFQFPTIRALAGHLAGGGPAGEAPHDQGRERAALRGRLRQGAETAVAVVGMSCRFPGAADVEAFWRNLSQGVESIVPLTDEELRAGGIDPAWIAQPSYIKAKGVLEGFDLFDAAFFNLSPMDAALLDPQQRLFLECSWEALEDAGCDPERFAGPAGVYAGVGMNTYAFNLYANPALLQSVGGYQAMLANDKDFLATRVSYKLDLRGPSMTVQTACSTSLVAIHLACQSLLAGECDLALAGGVRVAVPQKAGYFYQEGGIHSPDGHCRAFDARSAGMVGGDGAGVVVLKRLADALAAGDRIRAVLRGSAVNNDGARRVGYTAPGVEGQARVVAEALAVAGVGARSIGYVEAHGTATELGDPVEVAGLTQAFRATTEDRQFCALGSVKTNLGHLDAAAGVAGVIKTVLALEREALPPSLHFERPNPKIDFATSPFQVNAELTPWPRGAEPRRAGVSSLGIGGTNAHLVLEEAPPAPPPAPSRELQLLVLSARTDSALEAATGRLADHLAAHPGLSLPDVAATLQTGRRAFAYRRALVCRDLEEAVAALREQPPRRTFTALADPGRRRPVAFLFPGQGAQYAGMAAGIYRSEAAFRQEVDRCCEILAPHLGFDLRRLLDPPEGQRQEADEELRQTAVSQPALFVVGYALARLWQAWGIVPDALLGHSIGEYVAAALAGVFSLEDALAAVAARGALMQGLPAGAMLSVALPEPALEPFLGDGLSLAAVNAPALSVVSGPAAAVADLAERLAAAGVDCRRLHTSHAFHSPAMEPVVAPFVARLSRMALQPPRIPFLSNVTGTWIRPEEATDPAYWGRHLRLPVRFAAGVAELLADPHRVLLEVGPGRTLATSARQHPARSPEHLILGSVRHPQDLGPDLALLLESLGRLWLAGVDVGWQAFQGGERRLRVGLPTYPFERRRYWIDRPQHAGAPSALPGLDRKPDLADWFFVPGWRRALLPPDPAASGGTCLLLADETGLGDDLAQALTAAGRTVWRAAAGGGLQRLGPTSWVVDPTRPSDYETLLGEIVAAGPPPDLVVHLWSLTPPAVPAGRLQELGGASLLHLVPALARLCPGHEARIEVVANGLHAVTQAEAVFPEKALLIAPCRVAPQEVPHLQCRTIDVPLTPPGNARARLAALLLAEITAAAPETAVAYRGSERWVEDFEPLRLGPPGNLAPGLRRHGVYLVPGGLAGTAFAAAELLAGAARARLVVVEEPGFPAEGERQAWQRDHGAEDEVSRRIARLAHLEELGAEVAVERLDLGDAAALCGLLARIDERFGGLHGVVYAPGQPPGRPAFAPFGEVDAERLRSSLAAPAAGVRALAAALRGRDLDLCLVLSSNAAVLGGLGSLPIAAVSCFLDAFVHEQARAGELPWRSANWDFWSDEQRRQSAVQAGGSPYDTSREEGQEVLERLAAAAPPRIAVSPVDLRARLRVWQDGAAGAAEPAAVVHHPRPALESRYVAPRDSAEREIAAIWQELLGVEQVGIHDDFFELGGHSLLATRLVSRLRQDFKVEVPLRTFFETRTVADLARIVLELQVAAADPDVISQILKEIGTYPPDPAAAAADTRIDART